MSFFVPSGMALTRSIVLASAAFPYGVPPATTGDGPLHVGRAGLTVVASSPTTHWGAGGISTLPGASPGRHW